LKENKNRKENKMKLKSIIFFSDKRRLKGGELQRRRRRKKEYWSISNNSRMRY